MLITFSNAQARAKFALLSVAASHGHTAPTVAEARPMAITGKVNRPPIRFAGSVAGDQRWKKIAISGMDASQAVTPEAIHSVVLWFRRIQSSCAGERNVRGRNGSGARSDARRDCNGCVVSIITATIRNEKTKPCLKICPGEHIRTPSVAMLREFQETAGRSRIRPMSRTDIMTAARSVLAPSPVTNAYAQIAGSNAIAAVRRGTESARSSNARIKASRTTFIPVTA